MLIHLQVHWGATLFITSSSGTRTAQIQDGKTQRIKNLRPTQPAQSQLALCGVTEPFVLKSDSPAEWGRQTY